VEAHSQERLLRLPEVLRITGLSKTRWYAAMKTGRVPQPVPLGNGRAVAWPESEINAFLRARIAERDRHLTKRAEPDSPLHPEV
jgi:prophage regulatory protein